MDDHVGKPEICHIHHKTPPFLTNFPGRLLKNTLPQSGMANNAKNENRKKCCPQHNLQNSHTQASISAKILNVIRIEAKDMKNIKIKKI